MTDSSLPGPGDLWPETDLAIAARRHDEFFDLEETRHPDEGQGQIDYPESPL